MSPSALPTIAQPTAPPSLPTDLLPSGLLAGRLTALTDTCTEITIDDGVTVTARVTELDADDVACGSGRPARCRSAARAVQAADEARWNIE